MNALGLRGHITVSTLNECIPLKWSVKEMGHPHKRHTVLGRQVCVGIRQSLLGMTAESHYLQVLAAHIVCGGNWENHLHVCHTHSCKTEVRSNPRSFLTPRSFFCPPTHNPCYITMLMSFGASVMVSMSLESVHQGLSSLGRCDTEDRCSHTLVTYEQTESMFLPLPQA